MRIILILLFISSFSIMKTTAQEKKWLDGNGNPSSKEKAVFYRIFSDTKIENTLVVDYYISGEKAKEFYLVKGKKEGSSIFFYSTGEVRTVGKFKDGFREGMWKTYSKKGKIKEKGKYSKGNKVGVWKTFYKNI